MRSGIASAEGRRGRVALGFGIGALVAAVAIGSWFYFRSDDNESQRQPTTPRTNPPLDSSPPITGAPWFRDRTLGSGIDFTYRNGEEADGFAILESMGGGVALFDYDGDGRLDLFVTGGGYFDGPDKTTIRGKPCRLYRNLGNWKFNDVTQEVGLDIEWFYSHGAAVADFDCDGTPDLLVTGYGKLELFHNEPNGKGGRRFVPVAERLGLRNDAWSTGAGWADLDGNGFPDLYVCNYLDWSFSNHPECQGNALSVKRDVCPVERFRPLVHALFHNEKGKRFRNVSPDHGFRANGCGLGVVLVDVNADARPDIYVANDTNNNFLYLNRDGGKLEEKGVFAGVAVDENGKPNGSMGVDAADYDGSGRPSLWTTNFQNELHGLYLNLGNERFHYQSRAAGIAAIGRRYVGFGTSFIDVDNDGWEDLAIANGHVLRFPVSSTMKQEPVLLRNVELEGRRFFRDIGKQGGAFFQTPAIGRGLAIGDLDNDGWPDVVVSPTNSPVVLLRNEAQGATKPPAAWIGIKLVGRANRDLVGSTVIVEANGRTLTRFAKGGGSYLSANDSRILVGLADAEKVDRVTVKWSWGKTESWDKIEPNCYWEFREGAEKPSKMNLSR